MSFKTDLQQNNSRLDALLKIQADATTAPDLTPELTEQSALIAQIRAMLVGRVTEANATPEDILKGKKAYVGEKLVTGVLEPSNSSEGTVVLSVASKTIEIPHGLNHEDVTISLVGNKTGGSYQVSSLLYPVEFPPRDSYTVGTGIMVYSTSVGSLSVGVGGGAQIERTANTTKITLASNQQYIFAPITFKWIATRRNT